MPRPTRNSQESGHLPASAASASVSPPAPSAASSTTSLPSLSPEFLASVVAAVRSALAADQAVAGPSSVSPPPSTGPVPASVAVPLTTSAENSGSANDSQASLASSSQGQFPFVVPSFVRTFASPLPAASTFSSPAASSSGFSTSPVIASSALASTAPTPTFQQPFVVGPGFSPVPAKLVAQIVAGKYIDLNDLLSANLSQAETEPQLLFDGRVVLTSSARKQRRRIDDFVSWMEAFSVFYLVLVSHFPHRWRDLTSYSLLILRTYRQFNGRVWLAYDQAFREHAAATKLVDWSNMDVKLYNFHCAGAPVRSRPAGSAWEHSEARGSNSSLILCRSWNRGLCSAPYSSCRFAHKCSSCAGPHRAKECPTSTDRESQQEARPRSPSPPPAPTAGSKRPKLGGH